MARTIQPSIAQFSFDNLVSEVDAIMDDLRWLHLELTLRNRCTELLFLEAITVEGLLEQAFLELRQKLGVLDLAVFLRMKNSCRIAFHDQDENAAELLDRAPWFDSVNRWFVDVARDPATPAEVNHYTVEAQAITTIAMPVILNRSCIAVVILVVPSSNIVPRLKKLLSGLSGTLSLSIESIRGRREKTSHATESAHTERIQHADAGSAHAGTGFSVLPVKSLYAMIVARDLSLVEINDRLASDTGISIGTSGGRPIIDLIVPPEEADAARNALAASLDPADGSNQPLAFRVLMKHGGAITVAWLATPLAGATHDSHALACFGLQRPESENMTEPSSYREAAFPLEARLSKQYRFMIKYVPFPIFHLDEKSDTIKNANPAFEAIIGARNWEGAPLSDYGTLIVHGPAGDTRPCTLQVISPTGITISYRGIITPLVIFGKMIREVKLDPIE
jgi:PAS domain-containing protein